MNRRHLSIVTGKRAPILDFFLRVLDLLRLFRVLPVVPDNAQRVGAQVGRGGDTARAAGFQKRVAMVFMLSKSPELSLMPQTMPGKAVIRRSIRSWAIGVKLICGM